MDKYRVIQMIIRDVTTEYEFESDIGQFGLIKAYTNDPAGTL